MSRYCSRLVLISFKTFSIDRTWIVSTSAAHQSIIPKEYTSTLFSANNSSGAHLLLRFGLYGAGTVPPQLSHSSALFLHRLICSSSLLHVHLENMKLWDTRYWGLIIKAVEYTRLESFGVSVNDVFSPNSAEEVWDLLESTTILTSTERQWFETVGLQ
ncbi:MAG: hypothetical protein BYD32DRAFT_467399 [Podila humilis]|nr:MAG: hypothetical protein BYD32DRAFT_467399 [Podila humilis]